MRRRNFLALLPAGPLAWSLAPRALAAAGTSGAAVAQLQQNWKALLAPGADVALTTEPLTKSEAEWKQPLDGPQFMVLRKEGTERPFSSPLNDEKRRGRIRLRRVRAAAFHFGDEIRQRHRLAELLHADSRASGDPAGLPS